MKKSLSFYLGAFVVLSGLFVNSAQAQQAAELGKPAPDFKLSDMNGKEISLSQFNGKPIVLEWLNYGCPFVKKHYGASNMQKLQSTYVQKGVTWISISSSGPGREGYMSAAEALTATAEHAAHPTTVALDPDGKVGKIYGARTTPHMFVIDQNGVLVYAGAIDDQPSADPDSIMEAKNYVAAALDELLAGKTVSVASSDPYGCSVKYAS